MKVVYYSLFLTGQKSDELRIFQLTTSVQSLRQHNMSIPVRLHLLGELPAGVVSLLDRLSVDVVEFPTYREMIDKQVPGLGEWLELYPVMHKFLTMEALLDTPWEQVLYLDSDTYIHSDVEKLFAHYTGMDLYAREEPGSRLSPLGYHKDYLDEDRLYELAKGEACQPVRPFNSGVVLFNMELWRRLLDVSRDYVRFIIRMSLWMESNGPGPGKLPDIDYLRENRLLLARYLDGLVPLQFPGSNYWIKEQMSLWLSVGKVEGAQAGFLDRKHVLQGCEEVQAEGILERPIISHYYSQNTRAFLVRVSSGKLYRES